MATAAELRAGRQPCLWTHRAVCEIRLAPQRRLLTTKYRRSDGRWCGCCKGGGEVLWGFWTKETVPNTCNGYATYRNRAGTADASKRLRPLCAAVWEGILGLVERDKSGTTPHTRALWVRFGVPEAGTLSLRQAGASHDGGLGNTRENGSLYIERKNGS